MAYGQVTRRLRTGGVFLDGNAYRPYQLIGDSKGLKAEIIRLYEQKRLAEPGA
jgi:hypothetical protein